MPFFSLPIIFPLLKFNGCEVFGFFFLIKYLKKKTTQIKVDDKNRAWHIIIIKLDDFIGILLSPNFPGGFYKSKI